jgi:hypothetical protein
MNDLLLVDVQSYVGVTIRAAEAQLPTSVANSSLSTVGNKCFVFGGTDVKGACYTDIRTVDIGSYLSANDITVGAGASSDYCFKILIIGDACKSACIQCTCHTYSTVALHYAQSSLSYDIGESGNLALRGMPLIARFSDIVCVACGLYGSLLFLPALE